MEHEVQCVFENAYLRHTDVVVTESVGLTVQSAFEMNQICFVLVFLVYA